MKYIDFQLSEVDVIEILNSLSYFRNEIIWHPDLKQKERVAAYFNFRNHIEYIEQYNLLDNLHKRLSLEANSKLYNINNEYFFEGQRIYLTNGKTYEKIMKANNVNYINKKVNNNNNIKIFLKNSIDKFKKIV